MREMFCVSNIAFHVNCNVSDNSCKACKSGFFSNRVKRIFFFYSEFFSNVVNYLRLAPTFYTSLNVCERHEIYVYSEIDILTNKHINLLKFNHEIIGTY